MPIIVDLKLFCSIYLSQLEYESYVSKNSLINIGFCQLVNLKKKKIQVCDETRLKYANYDGYDFYTMLKKQIKPTQGG